MSDQAVFDDLPKYDPTNFQPPAWATGPAFDFTRKNGESSKSAQSTSTTEKNQDPSATDLDESESDEEEEVWEDAQDELESGVEVTPVGLMFTVAELQASLSTI